MNNQKYPYIVGIYKGEGRFLFIPYISHVYGGRTESGKFISLGVCDENVRIGESAFAAIDIIKNSPLANETRSSTEGNASWEKNSKYKNWISFWKNNNYALLLYYEDGHYQVGAKQRSTTKKGVYTNCIKILELPSTATKDEVGNAICEVLSLAEEVNDGLRIEKKEKIIRLLNKKNLSIQIPKDSHFYDSQDSGVAEIYQCYSYLPNEDAESSADFYLGIAPELDCNLSADNIQNAWEELHGKADFFEVKACKKGIFTLFAEMKNKNIHKKSYFLQMEEDLLLECTMDIYQPNRRKKLDEKLSILFEEFALNCKK